MESTSALDTSTLTGESVPVDVAAGDTVAGATVNARRAAGRGRHPRRLRRPARADVEAYEAVQHGKAEVQRLAERISGVLVPVVLLIAAGTFGGWLGATGNAVAAFTAAVAVLIIACPCALSLATPTAPMAGTGRGARPPRRPPPIWGAGDGGTDAAIEADDLTLVCGDLRVTADATRLRGGLRPQSRATSRGPSAATCPHCPWPPPGCSTR